MELVRCVCGAVVAELVVPYGARLATRGVGLRVKCDSCRDTILKHSPEHADLTPGRLLVMQTVDLNTGEIDPRNVGIWRDYVRGNRSTTRGGERLPRRVLDEALAQARSREHQPDGC